MKFINKIIDLYKNDIHYLKNNKFYYLNKSKFSSAFKIKPLVNDDYEKLFIEKKEKDKLKTNLLISISKEGKISLE